MSDILVKLLKKFDAPARDITTHLIDGSFSNPDKFGVDVLINDNHRSFSNIEVQTLSGRNFTDPYNILTIFKRKDRYPMDTIYITYNRDYTRCFCFCRKQLTTDKMSVVNARYSIYNSDVVYFLEKNEVLKIDCINKDTLNLEILNEFFSAVNSPDDY